LFESSCIRNGLCRLIMRILRKQRMTISQVAIHSISILPSGKVSCSGEATTRFGLRNSTVPFEVRAGIATTSRGHVLTFPGLEVSLNPYLGLFVPVLPEVSLDLGHNAQLLDVRIDGFSRKLVASARATITPHHTLKLRNYIQSSDSFSASFSVDVGRWLTGMGNFTN